MLSALSCGSRGSRVWCVEVRPRHGLKVVDCGSREFWGAIPLDYDNIFEGGCLLCAFGAREALKLVYFSQPQFVGNSKFSEFECFGFSGLPG